MGQRCDPECLLQAPETSKAPKVVRRGCKRCFGPRAQRSPKSLLHHLNPVLHRRNSLLHQCKMTLAPWVQKTFCTLSWPLWALLRFRAPVASTRGQRSKKTCDFCSGMVASPLAATAVTAILRCDFCAAKVRSGHPNSGATKQTIARTALAICTKALTPQIARNHPKPQIFPPRSPPGIPTEFILSATQNPTEFH